MPLKIHFLNVGHGDCTFLEIPGTTNNQSDHLMMVDINNSESLSDETELAADLGLTIAQFKYVRAASINKSWEDYYKSLLVDPYDYYKDNLMSKYGSIFRYIQTHPDMDHMSGLHRFFWEEKVPLLNFWDIAHTKEMSEEDFDNSRYSYIDWLVYKALRAGLDPDSSSTDKTDHRTIYRHRHATGEFWTNDSIEILSPTPELLKTCNENGTSWNSSSYVFRVNYGGRSVVLAGDAEGPAWDSMLEGAKGQLPCDILKAAHHGRESGHHADVVNEMDPDFVICSVGDKKGIPDASPLYRKQGATVFSTRAKGTITVTIWYDGEVWIDACGERIGELPTLKSGLASLGLQ